MPEFTLPFVASSISRWVTVPPRLLPPLVKAPFLAHQERQPRERHTYRSPTPGRRVVAAFPPLLATKAHNRQLDLEKAPPFLNLYTHPTRSGPPLLRGRSRDDAHLSLLVTFTDNPSSPGLPSCAFHTPIHHFHI